jgi:hypothetical protein
MSRCVLTPMECWYSGMTAEAVAHESSNMLRKNTLESDLLCTTPWTFIDLLRLLRRGQGEHDLEAKTCLAGYPIGCARFLS